MIWLNVGAWLTLIAAGTLTLALVAHRRYRGREKAVLATGIPLLWLAALAAITHGLETTL